MGTGSITPLILHSLDRVSSQLHASSDLPQKQESTVPSDSKASWSSEPVSTN
jgi:hypothetical protein